ncbi:hypothetical protein N7526_006981 [Penicillium atrosanguineum]|nr:hypothetical protein N7526_006981 [Penicillium atrosanguineum]
MSSKNVHPSSALLLLPPPPSFDFGPVKDVFQTSVSDVLVKLSEALHGSNGIASIDIALAQAPGKNLQATTTLSHQHLHSGGAAAAALDIELDSPGGIDARVVFVDSSSSAIRSHFGPTLDLQSLAASDREWDHVFYPSNEAGKTLADAFVSYRNHQASKLRAVSVNTKWAVPNPLLSPAQEERLSQVRDVPNRYFHHASLNIFKRMTQPLRTSCYQPPHYSVAVGGTFDHLHVGHKLLLTATALVLEPLEEADQRRERILTAGITGDALLVNKKYAEFLESWEERYQSTASFLSSIMDFSGGSTPQLERTWGSGPNEKTVKMRVRANLIFNFVEIVDPFGPTITMEDISALVVSEETHSGGEAVNNKRKEKGWNVLGAFEVDVLQAGATEANIDSKISSTDIRRRRMNLAKV